MNGVPPTAFLPPYTTFVRTSSSGFVIGSTFKIGRKIDRLAVYPLRPGIETIDFGQCKTFFRRLRNAFIRFLSPAVINREQTFFDLMKEENIIKLTSRRGKGNYEIGDWKRIGSLKYSHDEQQAAAIGSTWKWGSFHDGSKVHEMLPYPSVL
jgi:hypothetical protein